MALPSLKMLGFPVTIPSTKESIEMRPYLVKEERILLMAQESGDPHQITDATASIVRNCTFDKVEPKTAPYFDIEYLLLQLRIRSVGDTANPVYICQNLVGNEERCRNKVSMEIPLTKIDVSPIDPEAKIIKLSPELRLTLKYPTIYDITKYLLLVDNPLAELDALTGILDTVEDLTTGETHVIEDSPYNEQLEFLYSLTSANLADIVAFIKNVPTVTHTATFACDKCGYTEDMTFRGLVSFFN